VHAHETRARDARERRAAMSSKARRIQPAQRAWPVPPGAGHERLSAPYVVFPPETITARYGEGAGRQTVERRAEVHWGIPAADICAPVALP